MKKKYAIVTTFYEMFESDESAKQYAKLKADAQEKYNDDGCHVAEIIRFDGIKRTVIYKKDEQNI